MTNKELEVIVKGLAERLDLMTPQKNTEKPDYEVSYSNHAFLPKCYKTHTGLSLWLGTVVFAIGILVGFQFGSTYSGSQPAPIPAPAPAPAPNPQPDPPGPPLPPTVKGIEDSAREAATTQVEKTQNYEAEKKKMMSIYQSIASQIRSGQIKNTSSARTAPRVYVPRFGGLPPLGNRWDKFLETMGAATQEFIGDTDTLDKYAECYERIAKGLE